MLREKKKVNTRIRLNIITVLIYVAGIILLVQLFNLQIVNGEEYRQTSNTRLTRESDLKAARGSILDRNGNILAGTNIGFSVELYKSKVDNDILNNTILKMINTLEQNGDSYIDTFPIKINPFEFTFSSEERAIKWKQANKINQNATAEECFNYFKEKYKIKNEDISEVRKIINVRYRISSEGYSSTKSIQISKNISRTSAIQFSEQGDMFPGVSVQTNTTRYYTRGKLASHILGYIGRIYENELKNVKDKGYKLNDDYGKAGIEYVFEEYLKGQDGVKQIDMAVDGTVTDEYISKEAIAGCEVTLTIDANLQEVTQQALYNNICGIRTGEYGKVYDAYAGSVVVMNVKTGEILAMASYPDYDPSSWVGGISDEDWNMYNDAANNQPLWNRAVQSYYAPGSTYKMLTGIAALQTGAVKIDEKVNDIGVYPLGHHPKCWIYTSQHRGHGYLNITDAIKKSCNYFFYEMGYRVGIDTLEKYSKYFGLGVKTGIELPNETAGKLSSKSITDSKGESWYVGETLSSAIGQSYNSFSPLQMAKYVSMLTNGGENIRPTIVKSIKNVDGTEVSREEIIDFVNGKLGVGNEEVENIEISQENLNAILEGMRSVANETGGTAYSIFKGFNIEIGGKTGSAQAGDKTNAWFVGFAPFDDPEIAIVSMIEGGGSGSLAAYAARDIISQYFGMNIDSQQENVTAEGAEEQIN